MFINIFLLMRTMNKTTTYYFKITDIIDSFATGIEGFFAKKKKKLHESKGILDFNSLMPVKAFISPLGMCCRDIKYYY